MNLFNRTITLAAMAAALMMTPTAGAAQTPPSQPPAAQPSASTAQPAPEPQSAAQVDQARQHLARANASLTAIDTGQLSARTKTQIADVQKRINALEKSLVSSDTATAAGSAKGSASRQTEWGTQIAAIDKTLTALLGPERTTGSTPPAVGTSGTTGSEPTASIDETTRMQLTEVRTHLTSFATAMAGGEPKTPDAPAADPTAPASATPSSTVPSMSNPPTPQPTGTTGTTPAQSTPAQTTPEQSTQTVAAQPDEQAARRHLTEARNTLSALTQLPEASQLTGEARTQVSQLIANFNELITAQDDWKASYAKVTANLNALVGPEVGTPDPSTSGTTGAVGTSGGVVAGVDPGIRTKLVELRRQLSEFEKAAGGSTASGAPPDPAATNPYVPATNPPSGDPSTAPPTGNPPTATPPTGNPPTATPPSGNPPTATPPTSTPPSTMSPTGTPDPASAQGMQPTAGNAEVMRHVAAIEALLKLEDEGGGLSLTKAQVEQLRSHFTALRQALDKK